MDSFERAGLQFDVADSGPASGPVTVLLHGFPQQPSGFAPLARLLHVAGLRTLVPSQRGYSATARPRRRRDYRTVEVVDDVLALLDAAEVDQAHIVGHDWGGAQAWAMGAWHPDRVASLTVLSTPHPAAMLDAVRTSTQGLKSWYMGLFQLPVLPEVLARRTLATTLTDSRLPAEHVDAYLAAMAEPGALTGALNWYRGLTFSVRPRVGRVQVPTTYVWGRYDFALGRAAAERTRAYVTGPYAFVEVDSGHWLPEAVPGAVADAITDRITSATNTT